MEAQSVGACAAPVTAANVHGGQPCEVTVCMCPMCVDGSSATQLPISIFFPPQDLKNSSSQEEHNDRLSQ